MSDIELLRPLNHTGTKTIKTARLVLRRFQFSDHTDMFQWASDPDVVKYLSYAPHKTINETKAVLKSWIKITAEQQPITGLLNFKVLLSAILLLLRKTMNVLPVISDGKLISHIGIKG